MPRRDVKPGDVFRVRYLTHTEPDGARQIGYHPPDESRRPEDKRVFVLMVLGVEPLVINDEVNPDGELDQDKALSKIGWDRRTE